jgi:hypothetical protein
VGIFHPRCAAPADLAPGAEVPAVTEQLALTDVPGLAAAPHAVLAHTTGAVTRLAPGESLSITLQRAECEVFTLAPITQGVAVLGLADKFNSAAGVSDVTRTGEKDVSLRTRDGGTLVLWTDTRPAQVEFNGAAQSFDWQNNILRVALPSAGHVRLVWDR